MRSRQWFERPDGRRRSTGFVDAGGTIRDGQAMLMGDVSVEMCGGNLLIKIGDRAAIVIRPDPDERAATVQCYGDGGAMPERIDASPAPLVKLGPGGDYIRDWPPEMHAPQKASDSDGNPERKPLNVIGAGA